jgi:hypothetical protein
MERIRVFLAFVGGGWQNPGRRHFSVGLTGFEPATLDPRTLAQPFPLFNALVAQCVVVVGGRSVRVRLGRVVPKWSSSRPTLRDGLT